MNRGNRVHALTQTVFAAALAGGFALAPAPLAGQPGAPANRSSSAVSEQPYHVIDRWKIGGEGGWDYLHDDPAAHRLYIAHGPRVEVIDTETGKPVGAITGLHGTHGIAFDTAGKYGYVSDGGGNAVVVFDRKSLATVATIPLEPIPTASCSSPRRRPCGPLTAAAIM